MQDALTPLLVNQLNNLPGAPAGSRGRDILLGTRLFDLEAVVSLIAQGDTPIRVANNTGGTLTAGTMVTAPTSWDATNGAPDVEKADADNTALPATYILIEDIITGNTGLARGVWLQEDIDTSAYSAADVALYLDSAAGGHTESAPTGAAQIVQTVGYVAIKDVNFGQIFWCPGLARISKQGSGFLQDIADTGNYYTATGLTAMLQELFASALGGTSSTVRAYSGGVLQEPPDNATLTAAIASLMLLERHARRNLLVDNATPSATAGRGLVTSDLGVTAQAVPDATVIVASGEAFNHLGRYFAGTAAPVLAVTDPNPLGGVRHDIVVTPAGGGSPVVREGTIIATDPVLTSGDVPLARLRCPNGAVTISAAELDDLRQTSRTLPASKLLPASTADLLVLLATDQITAAVLKQAILNGAFDDSPDTLALFADGLWTMPKLDSSVMAEITGTIPGGTGAGKAGSLNSNPFEVIPAPPAGYFIEIFSAYWWLDFDSAAYDSVAGGDLLTLVYHGATDALVSGVSSGFGDAGADAYRIAPAQSKGTPGNVGIDAYCAGGDWYAGAGDSPVKFKIQYRVCPLTW